MSSDYTERDKNHEYNKFFYKYSPSFECPTLHRPCKHYTWIVLLILMILWMIALPIFMMLQSKSSVLSPTVQDFRGDSCGKTFPNLPYVDVISQINARICVKNCLSGSVCVYKPNGIDMYNDWCFNRTNSMTEPIMGMCDPSKFNIDPIQYTFEQLNKGSRYLYINLGASVMSAFFWTGVIILFTFLKILKSITYISLTYVLCICAFCIYQMVYNEPLDQIIYPAKYILFSFLLLVFFSKWINLLVNVKKASSLNRLLADLLPEIKIKFRLIGICTACFCLKCLVCLSHVYLLTSFQSTFKLEIIEQPSFPGGKTKSYSYATINLALIIGYVISSALFLNFLTYLKEYAIAFTSQVEYFRTDTKKKKTRILVNIIKDLGFIYKISVILELISIFNGFCRWVKLIAGLPVLKHIFQSINASMQETYEYSTKYLNKWYVSQRVFQGQEMLEGGQIVYYLTERNYPQSEYSYLTDKTSFTDCAWGAFSISSWIVIWAILQIQVSPSQSSYISLQYLFAFICFVHCYILGCCATTTVDQVLRVLLYCVAANKEMKYVDRTHHQRLLEILILNEQKNQVQDNTKGRNIFEMGSESGLERNKQLDIREHTIESILPTPTHDEGQITFRNTGKEDTKLQKKPQDKTNRLYYSKKNERKLTNKKWKG